MATWQENLLSNLLVWAIIIGLGIIIYCRVTGKGFADIMAGLREVNTPDEQFS